MSHTAPDSCCNSAVEATPNHAAARHGAAVEVRSGVLFPDWSVVKSPVAACALQAILDVAGKRANISGLTASEDNVWRAALELYVRFGRAPTAVQIAQATGLLADTVEGVLRTLHARDLVVLDAEGAISGAYPFTERRTGHVVHMDGQKLTAMCAIDALGAGAMYRGDTRVESSCLYCGAVIEVATRRAGEEIADVRPATAIVWSGLQYANGCAATSLCTVLAFFCSDDHLAGWRAGAGGDVDGLRLSLDEATQVGKALFIPRLRIASTSSGSARGAAA